jgi:HD-GYP domain-containing protein (c-di-GMP phosphodiesterase class II)
LRNEKGELDRFLSKNEEDNLNIAYGTLTGAERQVINHHIVATIKMLEALPWPRHLLNVPEYAGGHHERMDGKGYPKGLTREQMSVQARVMGIADIFEALTAKDRPYKPGKTLSESLGILGRMKEGGHVDPDLFDIFVRDKVYLRYAREFLDPEQIDQVDESKIPGYAP